MFPAPPIRGEFRTDLEARALYSEGAGIYRIVPAGVALPASEEDLVSLVRWAGEHRVPLVPRGAGSSVTGSNVGEGVVVDLTRMEPRILEVNAGAGTARTSAGIRWGELAKEAALHGLRLPPDPSSGPFATLGGMVATNASGARSLLYGSMRRWVLGLNCITAAGERLLLHRATRTRFDLPRREMEECRPEIERRFPATSKNSAGYAVDAWLESGDALDLLVGSEGTLAFITEIKWRLWPMPGYRTGLHVVLDRLDQLTGAVETLRGHGPATIELLDRTFLDLVLAGGRERAVPEGTESLLLVEFEGDDKRLLDDTVTSAVASLAGMGINTAPDATPEQREAVWRLRHAASPIIADLPGYRRSLQVIEDACVPVSRTGEYIEAVRRAGTRFDVPLIIFGHAGDGNIHVNLLPDTASPGWEEQVAGIKREVTGAVLALGGTTTGEHGDGRIRAEDLPRLYGPALMGLFTAIKVAFDPHGILNPGVKLPNGEDSLARLKAGPAAAPIPDHIADRLREIERKGEYLVDRLA